MRLLFIIKSNNEKKGGSVTAPLLIRDVISEFYDLSIDTIFFKENKFWKILLNLNINKPKIYKISKDNLSIEINSFIQFIIWLNRNKNNYSLFVLHGIWSNIYIISSLFCIFNKKTYCFHPHGSLDPFDINKKKKLIKHFLGNIFYKHIFKLCSGIVFTSNLESLRSKTFKSKPKKYIATLTSPNKIIDENINTKRIVELKIKHKIKNEIKVLLFLSRIDEKKGIDILFEAVSYLKRLNKSFILLVAGSGDKDYLNYIKKLVKDLDIDSYVRFIGHIKGDLKLEIMKISDLFVLPTLNENFGIAIVEALQNKLPVLITKEVYIHEKIIENNAGYICNRNPKELSLMLFDLLFKLKRYNSENYLKCFNNNFSRKKCADQHFNAYKTMLKI